MSGDRTSRPKPCLDWLLRRCSPPDAMASEQVRIAESLGPPGRVSSLAKLSWAFALEAPKLPTLIILFVVFVAIFAPLLAPHNPEVSVKPVKVFAPPVYSGGSWGTPLGTDFQGGIF